MGNDVYEGFRDESNDKKKEIYGLFMRLDHIFSDDYKYHFKTLHHKEFSDGVGLEITKSEEKKAIKYTKAISKILYELGLGNKIITSYNAILPMTYYLYQNNTTKVNTAEREAIKYFMYVSMIKGLFGGSSKDTINSAVEEIKKINSLSIDKVKKLEIKKNVNNNFIVNQEVINDWLSKYKKGDSTTKLILYILYSKYHFKKYAFHEDHMQADSEFRTGKKIFDNQKKQTQIRWQNMKDLIPNLQLLESRDNIKKSNESLKSWLAKYPDYYDENYLPSNVKDKNGDEIDVTLLENFDFLFNERKKLITKKLCEIFGVKFKSKYGKL